MANYFVAGVGRALLFKGEQLFADCRTLADSSITIGVTAEDIRGGEGNALFGQYYHDASFNMKLTDIMFNLDYIAANTGAAVDSTGEIFVNTSYDAALNGTKATIAGVVPVVAGGVAYIWYKRADSTGEMIQLAPTAPDTYDFPEETEYCIMYRKSAEGKKITISSQFIPETLHAVLTVALYSGDNCNPDQATKAGEVTIDIPRLQLSGAMDITMSATGVAQTALEGNALASGCTGCDGKAIYATITQVLTGAHWYDEADGLIIEDLTGMKAGETVRKPLIVYAYYADKAPRQVPISELTVTFEDGSTSLSYSEGIISGTNIVAGTANVDVVVTAKPALQTNKNIVVADA